MSTPLHSLIGTYAWFNGGGGMKTPLHRLIGTYAWFNVGLIIHEWLEPEDYWPNKDEMIEQVWGEYITKEA